MTFIGALLAQVTNCLLLPTIAPNFDCLSIIDNDLVRLLGNIAYSLNHTSSIKLKINTVESLKKSTKMRNCLAVTHLNYIKTSLEIPEKLL
jgi:hypothetical protein